MVVELLCAFILSAVMANVVEWLSHKYLLHGLGKKKNSFFYYHWSHHNRCRKNNNIDEAVYSKQFFNNKNMKDVVKEIVGLGLIVLFNLNWLFIWPTFFYCTLFWTIAYYVLHYSSHAFPEWGKKYLRHHFDHHMGKNQDANWGVTLPFIDYVLGTRIKYEYDENGKCLGEKK